MPLNKETELNIFKKMLLFLYANAESDKDRVTDVKKKGTLFKKGTLSTEIELTQIWSNSAFAYFCNVIKTFKILPNTF